MIYTLLGYGIFLPDHSRCFKYHITIDVLFVFLFQPDLRTALHLGVRSRSYMHSRPRT
jgi:hypothetical protein